jgi:hypothetical protein
METDMDKKELLKVMKEIMETEFGSLATKLDAWRGELRADREAWKTTELKANPEEMQFEAGHREVHKEEAAMKRHRGRNPAAERRRKPKERDPGGLWIPEEIGRRPLFSSCVPPPPQPIL